MSQEKYIRLKSANVTEFEWVKTKDKDIIVRYKEDGEIFLVLDRPLDQRSLIADAYHAGFKTGITLKQRYIQFLESLTYQLMPDHVEPPVEYIPDYEMDDNQVPTIFVSDETDEDTSNHSSYHLHISEKVVAKIENLQELYGQTYLETFYAAACKIWVEDLSPDDVEQALASPMDGNDGTVFVNAADHDIYQYLSHQTKFAIKDLLYTAIVTMAENMTNLHKSQSNVIPLPVANSDHADDLDKPAKKSRINERSRASQSIRKETARKWKNNSRLSTRS